MCEAPSTIDKKLMNRVSILYCSYVNQVLSNSTCALQNLGIFTWNIEIRVSTMVAYNDNFYRIGLNQIWSHFMA